MKRLSIIAALAALSLVPIACRRAAEPQPAAPEPPKNEVWVTPQQMRESGIAVTAVEERPAGEALTTTGRIAFSDTHVAHVFSPVTGRVTKIAVALGQHVRRSDALAVIDSPDIATAVADLQKAEADLAAAHSEYEREKELYDAHAAAQRDFESAASNDRKARAERDRAAQKTKLLLAGGNSEEYVLRAPIGGEVIARNVSPGIEVQGQYSGGNASELFTIGDAGAVWVLADVFEIDLPRVAVGAPVDVTVVSYPGRVFRGRVDWISGALDPGTRTARVRCTIDNRERLLRPEMYAAVSIYTHARERVAVPRSSILQLGDDTVAFVDRGSAPGGRHRFERRVVAVDESEAGDVIPVLRGLAPGEQVVSSGAIILSGSAQ